MRCREREDGDTWAYIYGNESLSLSLSLSVCLSVCVSLFLLLSDRMSGRMMNTNSHCCYYTHGWMDG